MIVEQFLGFCFYYYIGMGIFRFIMKLYFVIINMLRGGGKTEELLNDCG
jgi:hypothetical protein